MAEVEVGGIKFRGGKIFVILTALTTAGGALWGGFEFYKDYLTMKEQIQEYVAPDLSNFDKEIALTKEQMDSKTDLIQTEVNMIIQEMEMIMSEIRLVCRCCKRIKK
jgi:esterase/lipase